MATHQAQLTNAVNMDTGYVSLLTETEKRDVLSWTRAALGKAVKFVAGAYIENQEGDVVSLYRQQLESIVSFGACPYFFRPQDCTANRQEKKWRHIKRSARVMRRSLHLN